MNYRLQGQRELGISPIPLMPDGNIARLPIDPSAGNEHQLSVHGWPPNNIQEYANHESVSIKDMLVKNLEVQRSLMSPDVEFTDAQKAALCGSRYAQTADEFVKESLRIDSVRKSFDKSMDESLSSDGIVLTDVDKNLKD